MKVNDLLPRQLAELEEESDPLLLAASELEEAAHYLDLEDWILCRLRHCEREITLNIPLAGDHDDPAAVGAIRVQHYRGGQPTLGPVRLSREAHPQRIRAEAMETTWQLAMLELPLGGAAGAIWCDPDDASERELRELLRGYARGLHGVLAHDSDVLSPGSGCNEQTIAWLLDAEAQRKPGALGSVVGKPEVLWGLGESYSGTAHGIMALLRQILGADNADPPSRDLRGRSVSLQGLGDSGRAIAHLLQQSGARLTALADISGGLRNENGLDVSAVLEHVERHGTLFGYPEAEAVCNPDVLESNCDVLILAAAERQVTLANAEKIKAGVVIEGARGAVTRAAEPVLAARGVKVIPWSLATAGWAIAAHLEWARNTQPLAASDPLLPAIIDGQIRRLYASLSEAAQAQEITVRRAGTRFALRRIAAQMRLAGR